ncbi:hypothetical protein FQZ97_871040 [compost metagenome]
MHFDRRGHAAHELQHGQNDADVHRDHQVAEHGQAEGDEQDGHVGPRRALQHALEVFQFAHVVGDDEQDRGQGAERNVRGQRRQEQNDQHQGQGMSHTSQWPGGAIADIGGGSGDGAGGGEAAEQWSSQIGNALTDQLLIGVVLGPRHAIGHHGGQQRLDGAQHGNGESRANQFDHARHRDLRPGEGGQPLGNAAEGTADGGHPIEVEQRLDRRGEHHRHQGAGYACQTGQPGRRDDQDETGRREQRGGDMQVRQRLQQVPELLVEVPAADFG